MRGEPRGQNGCGQPYLRKHGKGDFGRRLKSLRIERGFRLLNFAVEVGVNESRITAWENRGVTPDLRCLIAIANVLKVSLDELCGREGYDGKERGTV